MVFEHISYENSQVYKKNEIINKYYILTYNNKYFIIK